MVSVWLSVSIASALPQSYARPSFKLACSHTVQWKLSAWQVNTELRYCRYLSQIQHRENALQSQKQMWLLLCSRALAESTEIHKRDCPKTYQYQFDLHLMFSWGQWLSASYVRQTHPQQDYFPCAIIRMYFPLGVSQ